MEELVKLLKPAFDKLAHVQLLKTAFGWAVIEQDEVSGKLYVKKITGRYDLLSTLLAEQQVEASADDDNIDFEDVEECADDKAEELMNFPLKQIAEYFKIEYTGPVDE